LGHPRASSNTKPSQQERDANPNHGQPEPHTADPALTVPTRRASVPVGNAISWRFADLLTLSERISYWHRCAACCSSSSRSTGCVAGLNGPEGGCLTPGSGCDVGRRNAPSGRRLLRGRARSCIGGQDIGTSGVNAARGRRLAQKRRAMAGRGGEPRQLRWVTARGVSCMPTPNRSWHPSRSKEPVRFRECPPALAGVKKSALDRGCRSAFPGAAGDGVEERTGVEAASIRVRGRFDGVADAFPAARASGAPAWVPVISTPCAACLVVLAATSVAFRRYSG